MGLREKVVAFQHWDEADLKARAKLGVSLDEVYGIKAKADPTAIASSPADFQNALSFFKEGLLAGKKVAVYGDYDVDGLASVSILSLALKALGLGKASGFYVPSRYDTGYGLNAAILAKMVGKGYGMVVAVDNGITKKAECAYLASQGVSYLILDHHEEQKWSLPAFGPGLGAMYHRNDCSAAFLCLLAAKDLLDDDAFVQRLLSQGKKVSSPSIRKALLDYFGVLAGLAVFSDCMPLSNPYDLALAKNGLRLLNLGLSQPEAPLSNFYQRLGWLVDGHKGTDPLGYDDIGFSVNAKLNAVARVYGGAWPNVGAFFLTCLTPEKARDYLGKIEEANQKKKDLVKKALSHPFGLSPLPVEVMDLTQGEGSDLPSGLSGLVANALMESLPAKKPVMVLCRSGIKADEAIGSLRGPEGLSLDKVLDSPYVKPFLKDHGGHEAACGFTLPLALKDDFLGALEKVCGEKETPLAPHVLPILESDVDEREFSRLWELAPFGTGFELPKFELVLPKSRLEQGLRGEHVFVPLSGKNGMAVSFRAKAKLEAIPGPSARLVGRLRKTSFNGQSRIELLGKIE